VITVTGDDVVLPNGHFSSFVIPLAVSGILSGCFSSTKEVDIVPAPAPVVQVSPPVVEAPRSVAVAPAAAAQQTTTSTSWNNGAVEQKKTTRSVDGTLQKQTTTTWNNADPSQTTTTTTTTTSP
jgi:uncharacterized lipoprotein YajG